MTTTQEYDSPESAPAVQTEVATAGPTTAAPTVSGASTTEHDERTISSVLATLHHQFPQADPETVQALVDQGFAGFGGARVTTFVPVLVLRACQEQLRGA